MPKGIEMDGWHVARSVNSFITIGLGLFAKEKRRKLEDHAEVPKGSSLKGINALLTVRRVLWGFRRSRTLNPG